MCAPVPRPQAERWTAVWIWAKGQRAAHLMAQTLASMKAICRDVGYPGSFRQPAGEAWFRCTADMSEKTLMRWACGAGRSRVRVNGRELDLTITSIEVPTGSVRVEVHSDFALGLPCFMLEGGTLSTGPSWEASLDGRTWEPAECEAAFDSPQVRPDDRLEGIISIPVRRVEGACAQGFADKRGQVLTCRDSSASVDFFHEEIGNLCFTAVGAGRVSVRAGETRAEAECPDPAVLEQYALPVVDACPAGTAVRLPERALRWAHFSVEGACELRDLRFEAKVWTAPALGWFECSDPLLNDIWDASVATLRACTHAFFLDGIKRDRLLWANDALGDIEAADRVFFDLDPVRASIIGQTLPPAPVAADLGCTDYPVYTVLGVAHDYLVRGDRAFCMRYRDRVDDILGVYASMLGDNGLVAAPDRGGWGFLADWAMINRGPGKHGTPAYAQMLVMRCFEIGAELARMAADGKA
jgi:alpha-L-rhamnosidase